MAAFTDLHADSHPTGTPVAVEMWQPTAAGTTPAIGGDTTTVHGTWQSLTHSALVVGRHDERGSWIQHLPAAWIVDVTAVPTQEDTLF